MHWPRLHVQPSSAGKPQTDIVPLRLHSACTPFGSVGLLAFTQAGMVPQQLPTSFTTQSALVLQLRSTRALAGTTRSGGSGSLIRGAGLAGAADCAAEASGDEDRETVQAVAETASRQHAASIGKSEVRMTLNLRSDSRYRAA